jgi:hypothetical protein
LLADEAVLEIRRQQGSLATTSTDPDKIQVKGCPHASDSLSFIPVNFKKHSPIKASDL